MPKGVYTHKKGHKWVSEESRRKIGRLKKGNKYALGKHWKLSKKTKERIREANIGKHSREKSNWWKGGISFQSYPIDWTRTLKRSIRERDHYVCRLCSELQGDRAFDVHHIDYDKKNCDPDNLITLCHNCHTRTNHNRKYWINYFIGRKNNQIR